MQPIQAKDYQVVFNENGYRALNEYVAKSNYSMIFVLVDSNTHEHCLARFLSHLETTLTIEVIEIEPGEEHKNLETCEGVWNVLSELNCDRKSLMVNLGGGVVTDLGGFVASTFKRGIDYINVPTTLLSIVDASVGGKTGVDLGPLKNQIGVISNPKMVLADTYYLGTLPLPELRSGYAEMLKHGLISATANWKEVLNYSYEDYHQLGDLIRSSISVKNEVVLNDPFENGQRKALNFGHTLGHAIESHFLTKGANSRLLHGEAIAVGMILAVYLSAKKVGLPIALRDEISSAITRFYEPVSFEDSDIEQIITLLKYDKKNTHGKINFVLLEKIGSPVLDQEVSNNLIFKSFDYYKSLVKN